MSSSDLAISVRGVSKSYTIRHQEPHITLAEQLLDRARHPLRRVAKETFWALTDVQFDLHRGEVLGLIGRNGAGKSTLLKILSRITPPSKGEVRLYGRVGSLLEVGTGFHPELTGRENIYLNGAILGMRTREIDRRFDEIVEFAGVEKFLDTPVKRFSSGMSVRLAFAVAAHLDTEILLLDEVLAVGDAAFQARSLGKVSDLSTAGRCVIVVSHNLMSVRAFATRCVLLENGAVSANGATDDVLRQYEKPPADGIVDVSRHQRLEPSMGERVRITRLVLAQPGGVRADEPLRYSLHLSAEESLDSLRVGQVIRTARGQPLAASFGREVIAVKQGCEYRVDIEVPCPRLAPGRYRLTVNVGRGGEFASFENLDAVLDTTGFEVLPLVNDGGRLGSWNHQWWGDVRLGTPEILGIVEVVDTQSVVDPVAAEYSAAP
jgi:lipopolysaccharide transport system ATP-binding protein